MPRHIIFQQPHNGIFNLYKLGNYWDQYHSCCAGRTVSHFVTLLEDTGTKSFWLILNKAGKRKKHAFSVWIKKQWSRTGCNTHMQQAGCPLVILWLSILKKLSHAHTYVRKFLKQMKLYRFSQFCSMNRKESAGILRVLYEKFPIAFLISAALVSNERSTYGKEPRNQNKLTTFSGLMHL